jgi:hypothetical protein
MQLINEKRAANNHPFIINCTLKLLTVSKGIEYTYMKTT